MRRIKLFLQYYRELGATSLLHYLYQRFSKRKIIKIRVPGLLDYVFIRNNLNDIRVFSQIFIEKEYDVQLNIKVDTIIDCGANIGLASLFFLSRYPGAKIIAIEPEKGNFKILKLNLRQFPTAICINKGIWYKDVNLEVKDYGGGNLGFITEETEDETANCVPGISIRTIINEYRLEQLDILKIDIEGTEEQLFLYSADWIQKVKIIFCEIHENIKPGLTIKLISFLDPYFDHFINGEYYVFQSRLIHNTAVEKVQDF